MDRNVSLEDLIAIATNLFPQAVEQAIRDPGEPNQPLEELKGLCWRNFEDLGFDCMADCFDAVVPKNEGKLSLSSWSEGEVSAMPWRLRVRCRSFHISSRDAHIELRHDGPLPGVTETGYRSMFVPMAKFSAMTPEEFIVNEVCAKLPKSQQMTLF